MPTRINVWIEKGDKKYSDENTETFSCIDGDLENYLMYDVFQLKEEMKKVDGMNFPDYKTLLDNERRKSVHEFYKTIIELESCFENAAEFVKRNPNWKFEFIKENLIDAQIAVSDHASALEEIRYLEKEELNVLKERISLVLDWFEESGKNGYEVFADYS